MMTDNQVITSSGKQTIYRRHYVKRDGRDLFLYGYEAHTLAPLEEENTDIPKGGEFRYHPLRQDWNTYAPHRQNRTFKPCRLCAS